MKNKILVISTFFLLIISIFSLTYAANVTNSIENGVMDIKAAAEDTGNTVKDMAEDAGEGMKDVTDSVMNTANRTMDGTENMVDDSKNTIDSGNNNETTTENLTGSYNTTKTDADIGTATTISVIDNNRAFIGGLILPGVRTAMNALIHNTAQLPQIKLPKLMDTIIGKDTVSSIQNGIVYGNAACLDGLFDRISNELGYEPKIIATGGNMSAIIPFCRHKVITDKYLLIKGLSLIFNQNKEAYINAQR